MLITFLSCLISLVALFLFRQLDRLDDWPAIIIVLIITSLIADVFKQDNVNVVDEEQKKRSEKEPKYASLNNSNSSALGLLLYGIVYVVLFAYCIIELFIGITDGDLFLRLVLPSVLLFSFDTIFGFMYCEKEISRPEDRKKFVYYYEASFLYFTCTALLKLIFVLFLLTIPLGVLIFAVMFFVWLF